MDELRMYGEGRKEVGKSGKGYGSEGGEGKTTFLLFFGFVIIFGKFCLFDLERERKDEMGRKWWWIERKMGDLRFSTSLITLWICYLSLSSCYFSGSVCTVDSKEVLCVGVCTGGKKNRKETGSWIFEEERMGKRVKENGGDSRKKERKKGEKRKWWKKKKKRKGMESYGKRIVFLIFFLIFLKRGYGFLIWKKEKRKREKKGGSSFSVFSCLILFFSGFLVFFSCIFWRSFLFFLGNVFDFFLSTFFFWFFGFFLKKKRRKSVFVWVFVSLFLCLSLLSLSVFLGIFVCFFSFFWWEYIYMGPSSGISGPSDHKAAGSHLPSPNIEKV
jgi:hypothetical protein